MNFDFKAHARHALLRTRSFTNEMLKSFETRSQWLLQPHRQANHALWIVGHLALADNMFASRFAPDTASKPDGWDEIFWKGSQIQSSSSYYPPTQDVQNYFNERRENLLQVLGNVTDTQLAAPAPGPDERSPIAGAPNMGQLLLFASQHEYLHNGQLSVARRALGRQPLIG